MNSNYFKIQVCMSHSLLRSMYLYVIFKFSESIIEQSRIKGNYVTLDFNVRRPYVHFGKRSNAQNLDSTNILIEIHFNHNAVEYDNLSLISIFQDLTNTIRRFIDVLREIFNGKYKHLMATWHLSSDDLDKPYKGHENDLFLDSSVNQLLWQLFVFLQSKKELKISSNGVRELFSERINDFKIETNLNVNIFLLVGNGFYNYWNKRTTRKGTRRIGFNRKSSRNYIWRIFKKI